MRTARRRTAALLLLAATSAPACGGRPAPPPFQAVADTKLLMQAMLDPSADEIWDSAGEVLTADGVQDLRPQTEEQWIAVRNHAITVSETGNLLMIAPRAADADQWMRFSRALVAAGEQAWRAADAKDADRLLSAGDELYTACVNCHEKYMPANR